MKRFAFAAQNAREFRRKLFLTALMIPLLFLKRLGETTSSGKETPWRFRMATLQQLLDNETRHMSDLTLMRVSIDFP
jgi:hypothetical protein